MKIKMQILLFTKHSSSHRKIGGFQGPIITHSIYMSAFSWSELQHNVRSSPCARVLQAHGKVQCWCVSTRVWNQCDLLRFTAKFAGAKGCLIAVSERCSKFSITSWKATPIKHLIKKRIQKQSKQRKKNQCMSKSVKTNRKKNTQTNKQPQLGKPNERSPYQDKQELCSGSAV